MELEERNRSADLKDLSLADYISLLGSDAPAPGGGSAAAFAGAQGAALTAMVCALTLGRKKYAAYQDLAELSFIRMREFQAAFLTLMQSDTDAFNCYRAALAMPKQTEEEQAARKAAIDEATLACIRLPMQVMELAQTALLCTEALVGKTNQNAVSDLGVAAMNLRAALHGAWLNVKINLPGLSDAEMASAFRKQGEVLLSNGTSLADRIVLAVEESLS